MLSSGILSSNSEYTIPIFCEWEVINMATSFKAKKSKFYTNNLSTPTALKWCSVVLEKTLKRPWDRKEIKPVYPKGNQPCLFIGRTDRCWSSNALATWREEWFIGKNPDAGEDWRQENKGRREDEMVGWHHQLNGHELDQAPGVGNGQGSLVCCSPWGRKESDMTERLNWTELP